MDFEALEGTVGDVALRALVLYHCLGIFAYAALLAGGRGGFVGVVSGLLIPCMLEGGVFFVYTMRRGRGGGGR